MTSLSANAMGQAKTGKKASPDYRQAAGGRVEVPSRASSPLFKGSQGKQKTEIHYDPATRVVTIKLVVQDPNGYFIPDIRRENFVVYENGIKQNADVDIEHAAASLGLLFEFGGRSQALNKEVGVEAAQAGRQVLDILGPRDKTAVWKYADRVEKLVDFTQGKDAVDSLFLSLETPPFSETNLYGRSHLHDRPDAPGQREESGYSDLVRRGHIQQGQLSGSTRERRQI
jgi:hypothetical protein